MSKNITLNIEQIKKNKDGLDVINDIYIYAVLGEKVSEDDLIRFKWYGIHKQENTKDEYFKLRIPLTLGQLTLEQIKTLSHISKKYAQNSLTITNAQKIELKWIKLYNIPHILNLLYEVNLNTVCESGHNVRNIITCPVNGIDTTQTADVSEIAKKLNKAFLGNKKFSNLPNKFKIAISGYSEGCSLPYIPDVSFNAFKNHNNKILFSIKILGNHVGFVTPSQVLNTAKAITKIYNEFGNRVSLKNSSFDSLIRSWGISKFTDTLESSVNFKIKDLDLEEDNKGNQARLGIHKSKIDGQSYIGCIIKNKNIESKGFDNLASILEKYDASKIKITHKNNIIILDAPSHEAKDFARDLQKINFNPFV